MTVKNLTGSKEVVTLLNRHGHGISYDQVLEIETRIAESQLEAQEHAGVLLPKVISPNVFSILCWDNIDLLEEKLSGRGATHCTNGIVVQWKVLGWDPPPTITRERKPGSELSMLAWFLTRLPSSDDNTQQTVPGWTGFNLQAIGKQLASNWKS